MDTVAKNFMWFLKTKKQNSFSQPLVSNSPSGDRGVTPPNSITSLVDRPATLANYSTSNLSSSDTLHYLNLRFIGVGFRGYIIKKIVNVQKLSEQQKKLASRWLDKSENDGTSFIRVLILKLGQSALTAYPIPVGVDIYCPTDQQQQADNQPLLLTSTDYKLLTSVASEIKSYKIPDVYKGSGVFLCERLETEKGEQYLNETTLRKVIKKK